MTPTRIQLRLQHQAGQRLDEVWATVSPSLPLTSPALSYDALTLNLPLLGSGQATPQICWNNFGWTLANRTTDACIFVNQQPVAPGHICHVAVGDILEIGLCRFVIETPSDTSTATATIASTQHMASTPEPQALSDLSIDTFMASLTATPHTIDSDAFDALPVAVTPPPEPQDNKEVIGRLNDAYLQALQDPDAGLKIQASDQVHIAGVIPSMPTDDGSLTLEEIISSKLDIDTIAERFSDLGASNLLEREHCADVLWLFAPEGQIPPEKHRLPPRTRQDHHIMSLNSSYRVAGHSHAAPAESPAP
jgi:hypothetical protein